MWCGGRVGTSAPTPEADSPAPAPAAALPPPPAPAPGAAILPAAERSRMERIGDAVSRFARDDGLRLILIGLGTVIAVRVVRIVLYRIQRRVEKSRLAVLPGETGRLTALFDVLHYLAV